MELANVAGDGREWKRDGQHGNSPLIAFYLPFRLLAQGDQDTKGVARMLRLFPLVASCWAKKSMTTRYKDTHSASCWVSHLRVSLTLCDTKTRGRCPVWITYTERRSFWRNFRGGARTSPWCPIRRPGDTRHALSLTPSTRLSLEKAAIPDNGYPSALALFGLILSGHGHVLKFFLSRRRLTC